MSRISLIVAVVFGIHVAPLAADAQPPGAKVPRIGVLWPTGSLSPRIEEFRRGLRELGYVEGQNILIEYRYVP